MRGREKEREEETVSSKEERNIRDKKRRGNK